MKLKKILNVLPITLYRGNKELEITGLTSYSKRVHPGNLFIAKKGSAEDGTKYIEEAIASGAVAILSETPDPFLKNVAQLIHPNIRGIEGKLADFYYGSPSKELFNVAVTGTCGKTTTTYLLKFLLEGLQIQAGLIGSIENFIGETRRTSDRKNTTPDVISCHKMMREMRNSGMQACCMEVTSHALVQGRVDEISFDIAIFTNLTHEHLDYHKTMEEYANAKALLFSKLAPKNTAIINIDSPYAMRMIRDCKAKILTYGTDVKADIRASHIQLSPQGTSFEITYQGKTLPFSWSLIGAHNVMNALGALGALLAKGVDFERLPQLLALFPTVPGRLERVEDSLIFVDYAHKPDALENVLKSLKELKKGRLITLFGCGGDRDQKKRPLMAQVAEKFSDLTIVTSDNPRSEDPLKIIEEIKQGFSSSNFVIEPDRRKAIAKAIFSAEPNDVILLAGKGHETYQIFAHQTIEFDDRLIAAEYYSKEKTT